MARFTNRFRKFPDATSGEWLEVHSERLWTEMPVKVT